MNTLVSYLLLHHGALDHGVEIGLKILCFYAIISRVFQVFKNSGALK